MTTKQVKILDRNGKVIGSVSSSTLSIGAAKKAAGNVKYERRDGEYCWVRKS